MLTLESITHCLVTPNQSLSASKMLSFDVKMIDDICSKISGIFETTAEKSKKTQKSKSAKKKHIEKQRAELVSERSRTVPDDVSALNSMFEQF